MKEFLLRHPIIWDALKISGMLFLLWMFDPFGSATNSDQASEALFYRVVAPAYPPPYPDLAYTTPFDDKTEIAVIVINDESLAHMMVDTIGGKVEIIPPKDKLPGSSATWPPSLIVHNVIVRKIFESAKPKALFLDFGFFDERDPVATDEFARTLSKYAVLPGDFDEFHACQVKRAESPTADDPACNRWLNRAPIFLPRADSQAPTHLQVLPQLANVATALVSTTYIGEEFDTYNHYDLFDCAYDSPRESHVSPAPSAALAMYMASGNKPKFQTADCDTRKTPPRLSVYWSDWGSQAHGRGAYTCRDLPEKRISRVGGIVLNVLAKFDIATETPFQTCPPFLTASAHDFLSDESGLAEVLRDRYVFYGGNFAMADDLIRPPTHDPIPGVYVHAMVLSNLLEGEDKSAQSTIVKTILTVLAIIAASFFSAWMWQSEKTGSEQNSQNPEVNNSDSPSESTQEPPPSLAWLKRLLNQCMCVWCWCRESAPTPIKFVLLILLVFAGYVFCLAIILLFASIAFYCFDLAPINYLGIFMFVVLHGFGQVVERLVKA